jgi:hypothetical protein
MKSIKIVRNLTKKGQEVPVVEYQRVSDAKAETLVEAGWKYCSKQEYKKAMRVK